MLKRISESNSYFWLIFHVLFGVAVALNRYIAVAWIYIIVLNSVIQLIKGKKSKNEVVQYFFSYYLVFEIFVRILKLPPFIPYESGKYLGVFMVLLALLFTAHNTRKFRVSTQGVMICLLSIPSIFLMQGKQIWDHLVFDWFGIFSLGLFVIYFCNFSFTKEELIKMMRLMILPLVSLSIFLFIKTPSLSNLDTTVGANYSASGGFGPNQVSGTFGMGIFILTSAVLLNYRLFPKRYIDIGILLLLIFRGILTFSRGGVFSAALAILPVLFLGRADKAKQSSNWKVFALLIVMVGAAILFKYINKYSNNALNARYQGQTLAVNMGYEQNTLFTITDGRSLIAAEQLGVFAHHPLLGVGPGQTNKFVKNDFKEPSHTEYTRLLSEHGIFGLIIDFILLYQLFYFWGNRRYLKKHHFAYYLNLAFLVFALTMCSHSGMRTLVTPFFFGLAMAAFSERNIPQSRTFTKQETNMAIQPA